MANKFLNKAEARIVFKSLLLGAISLKFENGVEVDKFDNNGLSISHFNELDEVYESLKEFKDVYGL